jgi:hypothetical protein
MQWMAFFKPGAIVGALSLLALLPPAVLSQASIPISVEDASSPSPPIAPRFGDLESPAGTRVLSQLALATTAAITLDDQSANSRRRAFPPLQPSLVANPSSQGISLRGLGSTSASRTSSPKTTSPSTTRSAAGFTGRSSPSSPSAKSSWSAAAPAISTAPAPSAASSTSSQHAPHPKS